MASVTLLFQGKRHVVPVEKSTPVHELLKQAVDSFQLRGSPPHLFFKLEHRRRNLDLSKTLPQEGVPFNSTIEVVSERSKAASQEARIAISLGDGRRLIRTVPVSSTLREMLSHFEDELQNNECGTLVYVRQVFSGALLDSTTLASIGIKGSARFNFEPMNDQARQPDTALTVQRVEETRTHDQEAQNDEPEFIPVELPASNDMEDALSFDTDSVVSNEFPSNAPAPHSTSQLERLKAEKADAIAKEDYLLAAELKAQIEAVTQQENKSHSNSKAQASSVTFVSLGKRLAAETNGQKCASVLAKYLVNILKAPYDERRRRIKFSNQTFNSCVLECTGGREFLECAGFTVQQTGEPHEMARCADDFTFLILPLLGSAETEAQLATLRSAHSALQQCFTSSTLASAPPEISLSSFNPFKSHVTSFSEAPRPQGQPSKTEQKLSLLKAKQAQVTSHEIKERTIRLYRSESEMVAVAPPSEEDKSQDMRVLQKAMAQKISQTRAEDKPFQTKAMRDLEKIQNEKIYKEVVIRVQFHDQVTLTANFLPHETISEVAKVVSNTLMSSEELTERGIDPCGLDFDLFVTPPRRVIYTFSSESSRKRKSSDLNPDSTLLSLGLVPAARVYVSFHTPPESSYLNQASLTALSKTSETDASYPKGVFVDEQARKQQAKPQPTKGKMGKAGKPSWMKL